MRMMIAIAFVLTSAAAAAHAESVYYVNLVNTAKSSITAFSVAPAASDDFRPQFLGGTPLHGGGDSTTIAIRNDGSGCLRDLRTEFADGRVLIQRKFDVCKYRSYHTGQYLRASDRVSLAAQP